MIIFHSTKLNWNYDKQTLFNKFFEISQITQKQQPLQQLFLQSLKTWSNTNPLRELHETPYLKVTQRRFKCYTKKMGINIDEKLKSRSIVDYLKPFMQNDKCHGENRIQGKEKFAHWIFVLYTMCLYIKQGGRTEFKKTWIIENKTEMDTLKVILKIHHHY